jgi:hypothetical protein
MLDLDETDLWPQTRVTHSRPDEVRAVYPHAEAVPRELWRDLFRSAERGIDILEDSGPFLAEDPGILAILQHRAVAGVKVRICLADADWSRARDAVASTRHSIDLYGLLRESGHVKIRVHRVILNSSIYRADNELLIGQHAFGVPARRAPVLHLHRTGRANMVATYLESFDDIWRGAQPLHMSS